MTTPRKIASNCRNALQSTGPQTQEGKAIASKNATKHGLLSREILLPKEDPDALAELEQGLWEELRPVGPLENLLFQQIVISAWRLYRFAKVEAAIFSHHLYAESAERAEQKVRSYEKSFYETLKEDITITDKKKHKEALAKAQEAKDLAKASTLGSAFLREAQASDGFTKLSRYQTAIQRSLYRAWHELERLQAARAGVNVPPPVAVDVDVALEVSPAGPEELADGLDQSRPE
jgi:hypothetical protein